MNFNRPSSVVWLLFFASSVYSFGGPISSGYGCSDVKPADVRLNLLNGTWYVQMYTGPTNGGKLQTECDTFDIKVAPTASNASINYTFTNAVSGQSGIEVANVTYKAPGFYLYQVEIQGQLVSMNTYVLILNTQYYVHMACSANNIEADATFLIASKRRDVSSEALRQLMMEAEELGADTQRALMVNQVDCNDTVSTLTY
ncbi:hypothetical protein CHUAL_006256 [Chamberlinius hualienensis]